MRAHFMLRPWGYIKPTMGIPAVLNNKNMSVGFAVLTAVVMNSTIFWDITWCNPLKVNRRFGGKISPSSSGSNKTSKRPA
jgi:hypothetical protein